MLIPRSSAENWVKVDMQHVTLDSQRWVFLSPVWEVLASEGMRRETASCCLKDTVQIRGSSTGGLFVQIRGRSQSKIQLMSLVSHPPLPWVRWDVYIIDWQLPLSVFQTFWDGLFVTLFLFLYRFNPLQDQTWGTGSLKPLPTRVLKLLLEKQTRIIGAN